MTQAKDKEKPQKSKDSGGSTGGENPPKEFVKAVDNLLKTPPKPHKAES